MHAVNLVLLIIAAVCFAIAAGNVPARINLVALGLLAYVLVPLIATIRA